MKTRSTTNLHVIALVGSIFLTEAMFILAMKIRIWLPFGKFMLPGAEIIPPILYVLVAIIWLTMLMIFAAPRLVRSSQLLEVLWRLVATVGLASLTFAGALFLSFREISRLFFIYFVVLDLIALVLFYGTMRLMIRRNTRAHARTRVLIVGTGSTGQRVAHALTHQWNGNIPSISFLDTGHVAAAAQLDGWPIHGTLSDATKVIETEQIDEIIVALPLDMHPQIVELVRQLQSTPVHIRLVPDFLDFAMMNARVDYMEGLPMVGLRVSALSEEARLIKRIFDICVSGLLLTVLSPFMLVIAALIRNDSSGPVIYISERVGENGRLFRMYKFRTMSHDAESRWEEVAARRLDGKLEFKNPADPRITRTGHWLRRTSLDELPQLFNVLKGDMSLVGPRPEMPMIVNQEYEPWQWSRFTVPQGMTGWWQVHRRGYEHLHSCTADDLYYIQNYSLMLDLRILFRTIFVVFMGEGTY